MSDLEYYFENSCGHRVYSLNTHCDICGAKIDELYGNRMNKWIKEYQKYLLVSPEFENNYLKDEIWDMNSLPYDCVRIGNQIWMANNLKTMNFSDGTRIEQARNVSDIQMFTKERTACYCHYEFDPLNGEKFGYLYNIFALKAQNNLALVHHDYKIPDKNDWLQLIDILGEDSAMKLKSQFLWQNEERYNTNYGFNAVPGGFFEDGKFHSKNESCYYFYYDDHRISAFNLNSFKSNIPDDFMCSVRCISR